MALQLEEQYSKDEILEAYLNAIPLGGLNYGVKAAAKDYFGKELSELTIRECAMLAGITQNPSRYNPRSNYYNENRDFEPTNDRTDTVLAAMYNAGFITKEQYDAALVEEVTILETSTTSSMYEMAAFVEYAVDDVITYMLEDRGLENTSANRSAMENELRTGGSPHLHHRHSRRSKHCAGDRFPPGKLPQHRRPHLFGEDQQKLRRHGGRNRPAPGGGRGHRPKHGLHPCHGGQPRRTHPQKALKPRRWTATCPSAPP